MHIISKLQRFWWRVGDECFKMNHRCNYKSLSSLQRWGWRVAGLYENLFFLNSDFSFFVFHFSLFNFSLFTYSASVPPPFHLRFKSVSGPFQNGEQIGGKWDLHRICKGGRRELEGTSKNVCKTMMKPSWTFGKNNHLQMWLYIFSVF